MNFRSRLGLFFVLIVIMPMLAVAVLIFRLLGDSEQATVRAEVEARQRVAQRIFERHQDEALRVATSIANNDRDLSEALLDGDIPRARRRARELLASRDVERIILVRDRTVALKVGDKTAIAAVGLDLESRTQPTSRTELLATLHLSVVDAASYAREVKRLTGLDVIIRNGNRELASTLPAARDVKPPFEDKETREIAGDRYRLDARP